ncbi:MAG: hypothetical protein KC645_08265 [Gemmatimonadetes bacterium]|nr:hypothetical protein [Gemmatimonadota bacterium]
MRARAWVLVLALGGLACEQAALEVPTADDVVAAYDYSGRLEAEMSGNVAEVTVYQPNRQLSRGGTLWAKVGPYVFLFSRETQSLFQQWGGLAGVRVITRAPGGQEVARALLTRDTFNDVTWNGAILAAAKARRDGTKSPGLIEDLVLFGEDHTTFEYSSRYVRPGR